MAIPTEYRPGFAKARLLDAGLAERYVHHTLIGDPLADAVIAACQETPEGQQRQWLQAGVEHGPAAIPDAPPALRDFFAEAERVPPWFDPALTRAGCRAFHGHSEMFIGAFVGAVLIEGFSTLISKSFSITGRLVDQGTRRLKQNNRHLAEIFLPGGLERDGDGWKLSVRIRLMHARVRFMLARSEEWDSAAWGVPLSAAHIGFATAAFSGLLLARARMLGVALTAEERQSFMLVWRYSGHLMGVEPALQAATEAEAMQLHRIGALCEPPPDIEAILLANGLINSAPIVAGITDPAERRALVRRIYTVSRALIGRELADQLRFPPARGFGTLALLRWRNRLDHWLRGAIPALDRRRRAGQFERMLDLSFHGAAEISYRLPRHLHAEKDAPP
ncbi:oxygenase MpaB family protein [Sediminicoccus sp. KRV36]|uniref:oxygenase MpaB family protein n=1 Tax=Sediminicoccus sp. KRV36 TaxID=3133721 RepID=UPI00200C4DEB|nr:oxygenase MpaB family protein [Sediminicoccus rosea]UPY36187.1 DUF2236 domain-containing protein [Sediminicoccus rosea]